ncbi:peroxiredoxin-like family protein [Robertkochia solimangrovi]|uniref:peroxiredoxin-like family protein n=1 Tax=Robertkochia solimangrovi TaxID=2213046 RepID=UPI00118059A9|nr:peroxiredoxin-like family protein [Robertkochia solimangrovi]TRZ43098.1 hypothetical protein DMZ48_10400 [Robertkochia solimangrovi]
MKKSNLSPVVLVMLLFVVACSQAQSLDYSKYGMEAADVPVGLQKGDKAPEIMMTLDDGTDVSLAELYKKQPVVVLFYRGYWCPVCNRYLADFAKDAEKIEAKGAKIVAVTPQTYENAAMTAEKTGVGFTIVSDKDGSIMKAFDVDFKVTEDYQQKILKGLNTSIAETSAFEEAVLPVPATFIIDKNGVVVYRQFDPDYRNRASVKDILANLPE